MNPALWQRAKNALNDALDLDPDRRPAFLDSLEPNLRAEVESLLQAHQDAEQHLPQSALDASVAQVLDHVNPAAVFVGQLLGQYRVVRHLGDGGMGAVFEAVREDDGAVLRVALKIMRQLPTPELASRFRIERQALARLNHANIARLLDWGAAPDGRPFLVMEFVQGQQIDAYCRDSQASPRRILHLFTQVLDAVAYAHLQMTAHGDLKPGNILVARTGDVKLLDFGIARLLDHDAARATSAFTPAYASPEQLRGEPQTSVSDVYSLGVVLSQLLCGESPFGLSTVTPQRILQQRLTLPQPEPDAKLHPELAAIIGKALQPEPLQRYLSVERFADDVRAFLDGRPVNAFSRSPWYRSRKAIWRYRGYAFAAAAVVLALTAGLAVAAVQAQRARQSQAAAERRFQEVRSLAQYVMFDLNDSIAALPGSTGIRADLVRKTMAYLDRLAAEPESSPLLQRDIARGYLRLGDLLGRAGAPNIGDTAGAESSYLKAIRLLESLTRTQTNTRSHSSDLAAAYLRYSGVLKVRGRYNAALAYDRKALELHNFLTAVEPANLEYRQQLATAYTNLGATLVHLGHWNAVASPRQRALDIYRQLTLAQPSNLNFQRGLVLATQRMALVHSTRESWTQAINTQLEALRLARQIRLDHPANTSIRQDLAFALNTLAGILLRAGRPADAQPHVLEALAIRTAIAQSDPRDIRNQSLLATSLRLLAQTRAALQLYPSALSTIQQCLDVRRSLAALDPSNTGALAEVAEALHTQGEILAALRGPAAALPSFRQAVDIYEPLERQELLNASTLDHLAELRAHLRLATPRHPNPKAPVPPADAPSPTVP